MARRVLTLKQPVVREERCERCGAHYEYDDEARGEAAIQDGPDGEAKAQAEAEAALARAIKDGGLIVPCPRCKALTKRMRGDHRMIAVLLIGVIAVGLGVAWATLWLAAASGHLFWVIGLLALGAAALGALGLLLWPFGVFKSRSGRLVGG